MKLTLKKETVRALTVKTSVRGGTGSPVMGVVAGDGGAGNGLELGSQRGICAPAHGIGGYVSISAPGGGPCYPGPPGNSIYQSFNP